MRESLDESRIAEDPVQQFQAWFDEAVRGALPMVNAMTLASVSTAGKPSARIVLLKGFDARGLFSIRTITAGKPRSSLRMHMLLCCCTGSSSSARSALKDAWRKRQRPSPMRISCKGRWGAGSRRLRLPRARCCPTANCWRCVMQMRRCAMETHRHGPPTGAVTG